MRRLGSKVPMATVAVSCLILVAVSLPGSSLPEGPGIPGLDKAVHCLLFLSLAVAVRRDFRPRGLKAILAAAAFGLGFSILTEAIQLAVDGRSAELLDAIADLAGFVIGMTVRLPAAFLGGATAGSATRSEPPEETRRP